VVAEAALEAFRIVFSLDGMFYVILGTTMGLVFGMLPGLGGSAAIALLLPITFGWDSGDAFILIASALGGVTFGGAITAILINTPGTGSNAATLLDGYPLAKQGKGSYAIGIAAAASALGALIGIGMFVLALPVARDLLLRFSYPEVFLAAVIGLISIAFVSRGGMHRGVIAGGIGFLMAMVGTSVVTGARRFTFGSLTMVDGFRLVPVVVGLFAISEALTLLTNGAKGREGTIAKITLRDNWRQLREGVWFVVRNPRILTQSSVIGFIAGTIPAVGGSVASFIAYSTTQQTSKDTDGFGHGDPRGVLASESANDAKDGGAMLPTMAFGIPGSAVWAVVLGAFLIHGLVPGRQLLTEGLPIVFVIVFSLVLSNILTSAMGMVAAPYLGIVSKVHSTYAGPLILAISAIGAYAFRGRAADVVIASVVGIVAYFIRKHGFGLVPIIIGLVLGSQVELALNQTITSQGLIAFWNRPISRGILIVGGILLITQVVKASRVRRRALAAQQARREAADAAVGSARDQDGGQA